MALRDDVGTETMVPLRIVAPTHLTTQALQLLEHLEYVTSMAVLRGAGRKPEGDVILCNIAGEQTSHVIADLRDLGIDRHGSIVIGPPETELSRLVSETRDTNSSSDAVVWEEVEERTSESSELSASLLLFMTIAILIGMVGTFTSIPPSLSLGQ